MGASGQLASLPRPTFHDVFVKRDPQFVLGVAAVSARGLASGFLQTFWFQAVRLPVRIEIPCVALKNTLDVTSAVQDTDNFDRVRQSMIIRACAGADAELGHLFRTLCRLLLAGDTFDF